MKKGQAGNILSAAAGNRTALRFFINLTVAAGDFSNDKNY